MPREKKVSFNQKLASYDVLIEDTALDSQYFKVSQFPEGFAGGRNGFLLSGTPFLTPNTRILVEVVNVDNETIYHESIPSYSEGLSRLVSFEIYENTPPGIYKVILLGQARSFANGTTIPPTWATKYNVRWTRDIVVEPRRRNTTSIRFKQLPRIFAENEQIILTPTSTFRTEIDYSAELSLIPKLESSQPKGYTISIVSGSSKYTNNYKNGLVTGSITASVNGVTYKEVVSLPLTKIINETRAESLGSLIKLDNIIEYFSLKSGSYAYKSPRTGNTYAITSSVGIQYSYLDLDESTPIDTGSFAKLRIVNLGTNTGEVYKTEISYKIPGSSGTYRLAASSQMTVPELLTNISSTGDEYWIGTFISGGYHTGAHFNELEWYCATMPTSSGTAEYAVAVAPTQYYTASAEHPLILTSVDILNGLYLNVPLTGSSVSPYVFGTNDSFVLFRSSEYTLKFSAVFSNVTGSTKIDATGAKLYIYLAPTPESRILDKNPLGQLLGIIEPQVTDGKQLFDEFFVNFYPSVSDFGNVALRFIATTGFWTFTDISIKPAEEFSFNPDETVVLVPNYVDNNQVEYKARFYDINGNSTKLEITSDPINFTGPRKYVLRSGDSMYDELFIEGLPIQQEVLNSLHTGLTSGGIITINPDNSASYDISAGGGYIVDNYSNPLAATYTYVTWSKFEGITPTGLNTFPRTNIAIDIDGNIFEKSSRFTRTDYRNYIVLGRIAHVGVPYIQRTLSLPLTTYNRHFHWFDAAYGKPVNITGNIYAPSGSSMSISKTAGETYRIGSNYINNTELPDITSDPSVSLVTFAYRYRSGSVFAETTATTIITGSLYDDGSGTLQTVNPNRFTIQRVYYFAATNTTRIQFGQTVYNSLVEAEAAIFGEPFVVDPNLEEDAVLRAYIIVRGAATNLSLSTDALFVDGKTAGGGGSGISLLSELQDVSLTTLDDGNVLVYNSASNAWINSSSVKLAETASSVEYTNIQNLPTLVSQSTVGFNKPTFVIEGGDWVSRDLVATASYGITITSGSGVLNNTVINWPTSDVTSSAANSIVFVTPAGVVSSSVTSGPFFAEAENKLILHRTFVDVPSFGARIYSVDESRTYNRTSPRGELNTYRLQDYVVSTGTYSGSVAMDTIKSRINYYFANLALLEFIGEYPEIVHNHLKQQIDLFYSTSTGTGETDWVTLHGTTWASDFLYWAYDVNSPLSSPTKVRADSHDSYAATFILLAVKYAKEVEGGLVWWDANYNSIFNALFRNILLREQFMGAGYLTSTFQDILVYPILQTFDNFEVYAAVREMFALMNSRGGSQAADAAFYGGTLTNVLNGLRDAWSGSNADGHTRWGYSGSAWLTNDLTRLYPDLSVHSGYFLYDITETIASSLSDRGARAGRANDLLLNTAKNWYDSRQYDLFPNGYVPASLVSAGHQDIGNAYLEFVATHVANDAPLRYNINEVGWVKRIQATSPTPPAEKFLGETPNAAQTTIITVPSSSMPSDGRLIPLNALNASTVAGIVPTANNIILYPFIVPRENGLTIKNIGPRSSTTDTNSASFAIYTSNENTNLPQTLIHSASFSVAGTGVKLTPIMNTLTPGRLYWGAIHQAGNAQFTGTSLSATITVGHSGTTAQTGLRSGSNWGSNTTYTASWPVTAPTTYTTWASWTSATPIPFAEYDA